MAMYGMILFWKYMNVGYLLKFLHLLVVTEGSWLFLRLFYFIVTDWFFLIYVILYRCSQII
jgi:hypothetical protein